MPHTNALSDDGRYSTAENMSITTDNYRNSLYKKSGYRLYRKSQYARIMCFAQNAVAVLRLGFVPAVVCRRVIRLLRITLRSRWGFIYSLSRL